MKIAISGAGVAGPALAHWLHRTGHEPTLIERAPHFRTGGYVIDFWGVGYQVAQRMGIEAAIREAGYQVQSIRSIGPDGRVRASLGVEAFRRAAGGKLTSLPRGDLAAAIYATIEHDVETIFGDSITAINEHPDGVSSELRAGQDPRIRPGHRRRRIALRCAPADVRARLRRRTLFGLPGRGVRRRGLSAPR